MVCFECGQEMEVDNNSGLSNHVDEDGNTDYDQDADHVAFSISEIPYTIHPSWVNNSADVSGTINIRKEKH